MKLRTLAALAAVLACSSPAVKADRQPSESKTVAQAPAKPQPKTPAKLGPVGERAQLFREAADQLDKANQALERGNKNLAEQLFSTAELLVGADALAMIATVFREGAPPRVTVPTQKIDTAAPPQPKVLGNSEA